MKTKFTIRVYGILLKENRYVLLSDERIEDFCFTKFPGGGLEFGEGTLDCVRREWLEEFDVKVEVLNHFYTTDFCQLSAFDKHTQVISIYYLLSCDDLSKFDAKNFSSDDLYNGEVRPKWVEVDELITEFLTFPIDKKVAQLLKEYVFTKK